MRKRVVSDGMSAGCEVRNLGGIHRLPVLPLFVAGSGVRIDIRAVERERLAASTFGKGGHNKKYAPSAEGFEQRRSHGVVALSSVIKGKQQQGLRTDLRWRVIP